MISIITPCYNSEKYIREMIESVISQTFTNWELLITDDCSTDNTVSIIYEYIKKDKRIKLFSTSKNSGHPSEPRNISLSNANGDYVAFLDSDDIWLPNKLEEQYNFIKEKNANLICSYCHIIKENGEFTNRILKTKNNSSYFDMLRRYELISPTIFCTKSVAKMLNFPNCEKEDYIAWLEITKKGINILSTQTINALYRENKNSRSGNKIKMIKIQWRIYRNIENINFIRSITLLVIYIYKTLRKNYS